MAQGTLGLALRSVVILLLWNSLGASAIPSNSEREQSRQSESSEVGNVSSHNDTVPVSSIPSLSSEYVSNETKSESNQKEDRRLRVGHPGRNTRGLFKLPGGTHDVDFGFNIPIPDVVPDPYVKINHHLDFWPYNRIYKFSLISILNIAVKLGSYLYDISTLGFKILWQIVEIFQMKKSFDQLGHKPSGGWGWDDDRRLLN